VHFPLSISFNSKGRKDWNIARTKGNPEAGMTGKAGTVNSIGTTMHTTPIGDW
jgi:hypothetical protein